MKKNIAEPEMQVIHFNAQDILTERSGCPLDHSIPIGPCLEGCTGPGDFIMG